jgi:hypothetical protein
MLKFLLIFYISTMPNSLIPWFDASWIESFSRFTPESWFLTWLITIFSIICIWKIFKKAWKKGRYSIIPLYNVYKWFQVSWMSGRWVILMIIPPIFLIALFISYFKIAKRFWKGIWTWIGLLVLNPIFLGILAFWDSKYSK